MGLHCSIADVVLCDMDDLRGQFPIATQIETTIEPNSVRNDIRRELTY